MNSFKRYIREKWSREYKQSINCSNPKGFSQRAHCAGKRKRKLEGGVALATAPAQNGTAQSVNGLQAS